MSSDFFFLFDDERGPGDVRPGKMEDKISRKADASRSSSSSSSCSYRSLLTEKAGETLSRTLPSNVLSFLYSLLLEVMSSKLAEVAPLLLLLLLLSFS
uniref:Uncharacterized protein n=1 Tax=Romanomermis culicivorax TaxID=13658 RepID=A0A915IQ42_ROMCU